MQRIRNSCDACQDAKIKCSQRRPTCTRCSDRNLECVYSLWRRPGRPRKGDDKSMKTTQRSSQNEMTPRIRLNEATNAPPQNQQTDAAISNSQDYPVNNVGSFEPLPTLHPGNTASLWSQDFDFACLDSEDGATHTTPTSLRFPNTFQNITDDQFLQSPENRLSGANAMHTVNHSTTDKQMLLADDFQPYWNSLMNDRDPEGLLPDSNTASACLGDCFRRITEHLTTLNTKTKGQAFIDYVFEVHKQTANLQQSVCWCPADHAHDQTHLLLSMAVEQTIALFERLSDCEHLSNQTTRTSTIAQTPKTRTIDLAFNKPSTESSTQPRGIECSHKLKLGKYEVTGRTKSIFVKHMIRIRLAEIATMVVDLEKQSLRRGLQNRNETSNEVVIKDSDNRIKILQGMLEMWT